MVGSKEGKFLDGALIGGRKNDVVPESNSTCLIERYIDVESVEIGRSQALKPG